MKTYLFPSGAKLVLQGRQPLCQPAWCNHISTPIARLPMAQVLRGLRSIGVKAKRIK